MANEMVFEDGDGDLWYPLPQPHMRNYFRVWLRDGRPGGMDHALSMASRDMYARPDLDPHVHDAWELEQEASEAG